MDCKLNVRVLNLNTFSASHGHKHFFFKVYFLFHTKIKKGFISLVSLFAKKNKHFFPEIERLFVRTVALP